MTSGLLIQVLISNIPIKFILLRFVFRKIKQSKTKKVALIYTVVFSGWIFHIFAFWVFKQANMGLIFVAIFSTIIDIAVIQWFRAFWEKDEDTNDLDYGHTSLG